VSYYNIDEVDQAVQNLAGTYPALCQLITLPNQTAGGRTGHAVRLGSGATGSKDAVMLIGGVHAREWGGCEILVGFAADLLAAYQNAADLVYGNRTFTAQQVRSLLDDLHLVVFPLVNPDGRKYSQETVPGWRKNRNPAHCGHADHGGVDINRNFDFLFNFATAFHPDAGVRVSTDPCHIETYQGPAPFSEAETGNVRWLLDNFPRTRWFVDVHSYSEAILYSWGDDVNQSTDPAMNFTNAAYNGQRGRGTANYGEYIVDTDLTAVQQLAQTFVDTLAQVRGTVYTPKPSFELYPIAGASDDYTFARHVVDNTRAKVYTFTVEFGREFAPDWADMQEIVKDVCAGLVGLCLAAPASIAAPVVVVDNTATI
jgi:murein tripeptide amidase MpaA